MASIPPELAAIDALSTREHDKNIWFGSLAVLAVAHFLDADSSWGKREANGLLQDANGRFTGSSMAVKIGLVGGYVAIQDATVMSGAIGYRGLAGMNAVVTAIYAVVVARNITVSRTPRTQRR